MRTAVVERETKETRIRVEIDLDGSGRSDCDTGIGFFDHMLDQLGRHSLVNLSVSAKGDTHIDDHHTVEDVGIAIGQSLQQAIGDKRGIRRYGFFQLPMDDAWIDAALDLSGRQFLGWEIRIPQGKIGAFDSELVREFFQALTSNAGITLHLSQRSGHNAHHIVEATFKAFARALRMAVELDDRNVASIPSTKGRLNS